MNQLPTLLQIDSSPMGDASVSRHLTQEFARKWLAANPKGKVIARDLTTTAIPVIDAAWITANFIPKDARTAQQNEILARSAEFTAELLDADEYVMGIPMHNWSPAASFKLWADQIVRFGETLAITPAGPKGTLEQKRATFVIAAGAAYDAGSASAALNYVEPWLRTLFGYLGVKDMQFIVADGAAALRYGKIGRDTFFAPHHEAIESMFAADLAS